MPITFNCPSCNAPITVRQTDIGKTGRCLNCGNSVQVPYVNEALPKDATIQVPTKLSHKTKSNRQPQLAIIVTTLAVGLSVGLFTGWLLWGTLRHIPSQVSQAAKHAPENKMAYAPSQTNQTDEFWTWPVTRWKEIGEGSGLLDSGINNNSNQEWYNAHASSDISLMLEVTIRNGRLERAFVMDASKPLDEAWQRVLSLWGKISPDMVDPFKQLQGDQAFINLGTGYHWLGDTEYAYACSPSNKAYVQWIGPQEYHKKLAKIHEQVVLLFLSWHDYVLKKQNELQEKFKDHPNDTVEAFSQCLSDLSSQFGLVDLTDIRDLEYLPPMDGYMGDHVWSHWPDGTKAYAISAARKCRHICLMAKQRLDEGKLTYNPFYELFIGLADESSKASTAVFGKYAGLVEHKEITKLPESLAKRWFEMSVRALAAQESK